jgi:hypothetical protein
MHLVVTRAGEPVESASAAESEIDVTVFEEDLGLDLPEGSIIFYADKVYTDYEVLLEEAGSRLKA